MRKKELSVDLVRQPSMFYIQSIEDFVKTVFTRKVGFNMTEYLIATDSELLEEQAWAKTRNEVQQRIRGEIASDFADDPVDSHLMLLIPRERAKLKASQQAFGPGAVVDLSQGVDRNSSCADLKGNMFTLVANSGLIWVPAPFQRWLTNYEKLCVMGFLITSSQADSGF